MTRPVLIDQTALIYCAGVQNAPPGFLRLAGHPLRWRLLTELARTDRQVRELTGLLGQPQSLVSYHLGQLRAAGLVTMRRSSADRRDAYYSIDLARCGDSLAAAGAALSSAASKNFCPLLSGFVVTARSGKKNDLRLKMS